MTFLTAATFDHLVRALLHSLWQGPLIALAVFIVLRMVPSGRATLRYAITLFSLLGIVLAAFVTWSALDRPMAIVAPASARVVGASSPMIPAVGSAAHTVPAADVAGAAVVGTGSMASPVPWTSYAGSVWMLGVAAMLIRLSLSFQRAGRLPGLGAELADEGVRILVEEVARRLRIRRAIRVFVSAAYRVPAVLGAWSPALLLPASILTEMPPEQLRLIVAHELAHIRRWDYLANFVQQVFESLLFFNPAVWWLSHQIRVEREACCDAVAVAVSGSAQLTARTLADVAARLVEGDPLPAVALAVTGPRHSSVLDRIVRILRPQSRPHVRLPLRTLTMGLVLSGLLLAGLRGTAELTVLAAEKIMTPAERIAKMAELQRDNQDPDTKTMVAVAGSVRTPDGSPLPKKLHVYGRTHSRGYLAGYSLGLDAQGHFTHKIHPGVLYMEAEAPGFAPSFLGPIAPDASGKWPPIDLVLDPGFTARIRLTDGHGNPIPAAELAMWYPFGDEGNFSYVDQKRLTTGADGVVTLDQATSTWPLSLEVAAPGYQFERTKISLKADQVFDWRLTPAQPTTGVVTSSLTGKPLANATVKQIRRAGYADVVNTPAGKWVAAPPLLAQTDAEGRFTVNTLRDDCVYILWVSAPGHGSELVLDVRAGQKNLRVALGGSRAIHGQITGGVDRLKPVVQFSNMLELPGSAYDDTYETAIDVRKGIGYFEITDPVPGSVVLELPDRQVRLKVGQTPDPVVIDLNMRENYPTRTVVLQFQVPKDAPPPVGKLRVDYIKPESPGSYAPNLHLAIKDGQATFTVPVPTKIGYQSTNETLGYFIRDTYGIAVPTGTEPFVLTVPAVPAGALHGTVLTPDGKPFTEYTYISALIIEKSRESDPSFLSSEMFKCPDETGKFMISPIPLGGKYRLVASAGPRIAVSEELTLDAAHPIQRAELIFAEGVSFGGKVNGPDGKPVSGLNVNLSYQPPYSHAFSASARTDRDGVFRFEHVNPNLAGSYSLTISPGASTQGLFLRAVKPSTEALALNIQAGVSARGTVIDDKTGKPLGQIRVSLMPTDRQKAAFPIVIEATTNSSGEFSVNNLEPITYFVYTNDAYPPGTPSGRSYIIQSPPGLQPGVTGGQKEAVEIRVVVAPWR